MLIDFRVVISKRSCKEEGGDSQRRIIDNGKETIETPKRAVVKINERRERVLANLPTNGRIFSLSQPVKLLSFSAIIKFSLGPASAFHVQMNNCSLMRTDELRMR